MTTNEQYVPTDGPVRYQYVVNRMREGATRTHAEREYTRWLAVHDARVRRDAEAELDSWMTRAYEAEKRAWKAEARIKAVQHLIDQADEMGEWAITCTRLQWAIDGSAPRPGA